MARPPKAPRREDLAEDERDVFDRIVERSAPDGDSEKLHGWMAALLWWPAYANNRLGLSSLVRTAGERDNTYSHADREFVDMVLAPYLGTTVVDSTHIPDAVAAGVRPEAILALREGRDDDLTDDELLLAEFIRQVVDGKLSEENWQRMEARLGTRGAIEYTIFITILWATMRQMNAFGCPEPTAEESIAVARQFALGEKSPPADWRARIR
jgi:hypothetical protein